MMSAVLVNSLVTPHFTFPVTALPFYMFIGTYSAVSMLSPEDKKAVKKIGPAAGMLMLKKFEVKSTAFYTFITVTFLLSAFSFKSAVDLYLAEHYNKKGIEAVLSRFDQEREITTALKGEILESPRYLFSVLSLYFKDRALVKFNELNASIRRRR